MSIVQDCVRFSSNDYEKKSFTLEIPDWRVVFVNIFLPRFLVVLWLTGENFLSISFFDIFSSSSPPPQTTFLLCTRSLWSLVCFRIHIKMYCPLILNQGAPDRQWTSRNYYVKISVNREIRIHTWGIYVVFIFEHFMVVHEIESLTPTLIPDFKSCLDRENWM